jgi:hypothetical protein
VDLPRACRSFVPSILGAAFALLATAAGFAAVVDPEPTRFDRVVLPDPSAQVGVLAESPDSLPGFDQERQGWAAFRSAYGSWQVSIDRRSGAPLLVQGQGVRWYDPAGPAPTLADLESRARAFLSSHEALFKVAGSQLLLNRDASAAVDPDHWVVVFDRVVDGVPVEGNRLVLYVVHGNLVSFGADRWGTLLHAPAGKYDAATARQILYSYMGLSSSDRTFDVAAPRFMLSPMLPGASGNLYRGAVGRGNAYRPVWTFALSVAGSRGTWVGKVDAATGDVVALFDDDKYAQVKGGVFTRSNDGICPDGCEQPGFPLPYADVTINGSPQTAGDVSQFTCSPAGGTATTTLNGPYFRISDACGPISESAVCDNDIDMLLTPNRNNCGVQPGDSAGNTGPSRTCFYQTNRIKEKLRYWLPSMAWGTQQTLINTNVNATCNASWGSNTLNMYREGGGCRNTGEIAGVVDHELGHGIDENDGGGFDNPSEAYADVTSIIQVHRSCVGRGFYESGVCSGYGDACLSCTGIRDQDYDQHVSHTPATPANFTQSRCGGGSGPCGKEVHCEAYPPAEAIYDLAARDLPAAGFDAATSWQLLERIWYKSRQGSSGNSFNCSLPNSDGCNANGWFNELRTADDDDGNLANGTPHAAAIYAAFARHAIACGLASDASNKSATGCPSLVKPVLGATAGSNSASLSWTAVPNAANYLVLRNEVDCDFSSNVIATIPGGTTTYVDTDLPNDFPMNYRVQAQGSNQACNSPVSDCETTIPAPFAGSIKLDRASYACGGGVVNITVRDANVGSGTTIAHVFSDAEPTPETVVLTETSPGSAKFVGSITTTLSPAVAGDGVLSVQTLNTITAQYVDVDDGAGGHNLTRTATAISDCTVPAISGIATSGVTTSAATVTWSTDESSDSRLHWGQLKPPSATTANPALVTQHGIGLSGLQQCTVYYYSVESQDSSGNIALDDRAGSYYAFETLGDFGNGLQPCHAGKLTLGTAVLGCSQSLPIKVVDIDLNTNPTIPDTVTVIVSSGTEPYGEAVVLTETGPNTSQFTGSILTSPGAPVPGNGILEARNGEPLTATYRDENDGAGSPAVSFQTATADCASPGVTAVQVTDITDESVIVRWDTSEPAAGRVDWGTTPALGNSVSDGTLSTSHALTLKPILECGKVYFRVTTTDAYGNAKVADVAGAPFEANDGIIPSFFRDEFETATAWTLEGEWQIGAPQGKGSGQPDPTTAFQGTKVLGHDLTGLGTNPGDYEPNVTQSATSPVIDAGTLTQGQLKFRRWLNVGGGGISFVDVKQGSTWTNVWASNSLQGNTESAWSLQTIDIGAFANGNPSLQVRFRQNGGISQSAHRSGWNVDRFVIHSGATPDFNTCGGCGGAPTFAGVASVKDLSACADGGIQVTWNIAPAWGTGHAGTYSVYRDTNPSFTPQAQNRIALGLAGTAYTDASAPNDVDLYYIVRAENDETCSAGPRNGGVTDSNLVRLSARDQTSQPAPGSVGSTLSVSPVNAAHARLTWASIQTAAVYRVYRAQLPQGPFTKIAEVTGTTFDDANAFSNSASFYYTVRAADACGNEGP